MPLHFEVAQVLYDAEIWDRVSNDDSPPPSEFPVPPIHYLGGYVDGAIVAVYSLHEDATMKDAWRMHFMVLKKHRAFAGHFMDAFLALSPRPIQVVIPTLYRSVINFARRFDFELYAIDIKAHRKGGRLYDNCNLVLN